MDTSPRDQRTGIRNKAEATTRLAEQRTDLAAERTGLAADRSLMAWIRTSLALIGFGFTAYKFLDALQRGNQAVPGLRQSEPRHLGIALITIGILAAALGLADHLRVTRRLRASYGYRPSRLPIGVALASALLGFYLLVSLLARWPVL